MKPYGAHVSDTTKVGDRRMAGKHPPKRNKSARQEAKASINDVVTNPTYDDGNPMCAVCKQRSGCDMCLHDYLVGEYNE